jgi:hypothetical protein
MSVLAIGAGVFPQLRAGGALSPVREPTTYLDLPANSVRRLGGDHRWRIISCLRGVIWITQQRDIHDYVLRAGEMFIVTLPGSLLVQAFQDASIEITSPLKPTPFTGGHAAFP